MKLTSVTVVSRQHDQESGEDRHGRNKQWHQGQQRAEDEREDDERAEGTDQSLGQYAAARAGVVYRGQLS